MKTFLIKLVCCGILFAVVTVLGLATRVIIAQARLNEVFSVPKGTQVLCIGNSHTGCTWYESPKYKNRVLWTSSTGFATHYMRFREFERRGILDTGIKYCIFDCDGPGMGGFSKISLKRRFVSDLPFSWRYVGCLPLDLFDVISYTICHASQDFSYDEKPPKQVPDWTTRTKDEQESNILGQYGKITSDWESDFPPNWQESFLWMANDIKMRCESHNIRLIFFAAPLTTASPARNNPKIWDRESNMINRVKELGIEYYDFRTSCADNLFRDSHHLLLNASDEFTEKFFTNVLNL